MKNGINGPAGSDSAFLELANEQFAAWVGDASFPCLGAKAAFNAGSYQLSIYHELGSITASRELANDLCSFTASYAARRSDYATFVAIFRQPVSLGEQEFERLLWTQLQQLHHIDAEHSAWDPSVSSDPADPRFSFSFAGQALYVVGMHRNSSRLARRFPWPGLIFNPHVQFEKLREDGKWKRMQSMIRKRDVALQGTVNPMLADFGEASEARQYSGRAVGQEWQPEFKAAPPKSRCPFAH